MTQNPAEHRERVSVRVYMDGRLEIFEQAAVTGDEMAAMSDRHARAAVAAGVRTWLVEIEFLDEPDRQRRFFRFGTDPRGTSEPLLGPFEPPTTG